jgi:MFS family permease
MSKIVPIPSALKNLTRDGWLLFLTRFVRLFAYGSLSVILVFYLVGLGLTESQVGLLLTLTLAGDIVISLYLSTRADRIGRRRMLIVGSVLMAAAGLAFAFTSKLIFLIVAGTIGVISPSGHEVGPFLSIEQAALSHVVSSETRTEVFAWYTLAGSIATAAGALCGGVLSQALQANAVTAVSSYRVVVISYAAMGVMLAFLFGRLSSAAEAAPANEGSSKHSPAANFFGIHKSRRIILPLSSLFALDSFAGGFVVQSFAAYWFYLRFGLNPGKLGLIFFWANVFAGFSALLASRLASRIGLIKTMVFTHLPSNVLLILVPLMPNLPLAVLVLLIRFSISQMDVPARQSYTMAVVSPEERSAAGGITGVARTTGAAVSPFFAGLLFARPALIGVPFFIAGGLKIVYDLLLYRKFVAIQPKDETVNSPFSSGGEESDLGSSMKEGNRTVLVEASDVQKGSES